MNNSPFNVAFGEKPNNYINRSEEFDRITAIFNDENPETKVLLITGARGVGKTVLLSAVKKYYDDKNEWITTDINPTINILDQLASKIYESGLVKKLFEKKEFNFSFKGIGFSIKGDTPVSSIHVLLEKILAYLKKKKIKLLVTIDEISNTSEMNTFIHSYQSFIREDYDVFFLATGLYENIEKLSSEKNSTFLSRAPKLFLGKLNLKAITFSYMNIFNISEEDAIKIAKQTNGYAYGYQLLGSILYKSEKTKIDKDILQKYDLSLDDNSYSLIWNALSENEIKILYAIANTDGKIQSIIAFSKLTNSAIQVYKKKLINKGIVDDSSRGKLSFILPRFKEFVSFQYKLYVE